MKEKEVNKTKKTGFHLSYKGLLLLLWFIVATASNISLYYLDAEQVTWLSQQNLEEESDQTKTKSKKQDEEKFKRNNHHALDHYQANSKKINDLICQRIYFYRAPILDILTPPPEFLV